MILTEGLFMRSIFMNSLVISDTNGELFPILSPLLDCKIKVLNFLEPQQSNTYNPFEYIRAKKDIDKMVDVLIDCGLGFRIVNTPLIKTEKALLRAICYYAHKELPKEQQNFGRVMEILKTAAISATEENFYSSELDVLFGELACKNPKSKTAQQYKIYKEILADGVEYYGLDFISVFMAVNMRLSSFHDRNIIDLMNTDTLDLENMGTEETALFVMTPKKDYNSPDSIAFTLYMQIFDTLKLKADKEHDGKLPVPLLYLFDENSMDFICGLISAKHGEERSKYISAMGVQILDGLKNNG